MSQDLWTYIFVAATFSLYLVIAWLSRVKDTKGFFIAGGGVPAAANGMATAADWMSAASFISMAGLIAFDGRDGSRYLMGWTGGYVLLALLLAPYLRKFGKFTVPDFVGDRYDSRVARIVAVLCAIFVSFTYVAGQMRGVGVVFSRFLEVDITLGVFIGMFMVFAFAVLGGMKGITYTQVAQYCVLIFAFMVPAIFIAIQLTGNPIPQVGFGGNLAGEIGSRIADGQQIGLLDKLDGLNEELGFSRYTDGTKSTLDVFCITAALMVGTAGLPHVIIRFYTVPKVRDARISAFWALLFIAILYTAAPAVGAFGRVNLIDTVTDTYYSQQDADASGVEGEEAIPAWFKKWENAGLLAWVDKNGDGRIQYTGKDGKKVNPFVGAKPQYLRDDDGEPLRGSHGERLIGNEIDASNDNELFVDQDIMVLANPEIAGLPNWVIGLVAAGGLAAALSTAAGLLLVVSTAISHDLCKKIIAPGMSDKKELLVARISAAVAVAGAGYLGINPPDYVAATVAFAFGLAASSFFPAIILGIFVKRANREGVICGMLAGVGFTAGYIIYFKFMGGSAENYLLGISPEGIGTVGMAINFLVAFFVSNITKEPPQEVQDLVESIRVPKGAGAASEH
ncbi:MAG: sodium:solute symporter family protein [Planctomycetota bacterium]